MEWYFFTLLFTVLPDEYGVVCFKKIMKTGLSAVRHSMFDSLSVYIKSTVWNCIGTVLMDYGTARLTFSSIMVP